MLDLLANNADILFATGSALFGILLAPTIFDQMRTRASSVPLTSSGPTVVTLVLFVFLYASLGYWIAAVVESVQAMAWAIVGFQRYKYGDTDRVYR